MVGLSQGGWIATRYAIRYPEKVSKLVLLASAGICNTRFISINGYCTHNAGKWGTNKLNKYVFGNVQIDQMTFDYMNAIMHHFTPLH
ncbi:MAG: alpha/beta fold hydrolase [Patescibacteria group bacterium]